MPAAGCAALGCATRVTRQKRNASIPNHCCRACQGRYPRRLTLVNALQGTLNAPDGSHATDTRSHEPSEERALLPTSRGKDDERALSPTALIYASAHSEASRPTVFHSADTCPPDP